MSDSLSRLVEAVRSAGVDIAPGYCEYVRLAFAIANDCGEAGREGFIALCSLSVKFNREKAERLFSNSLKKGDHRIHLGTAFHLAELAGVRLEPPSRPRDTHASNASNANNAAPVSHTRAYILKGRGGRGIMFSYNPLVFLPFGRFPVSANVASNCMRCFWVSSASRLLPRGIDR